VRVLAFAVKVRVPERATAPVPRFKELEPVKVKSPVRFSALFVAMETAAPEVLSKVVLAAMVHAPVPKGELLAPPERFRFN
jgi:hypothetical protein